MTAKIAHRTGPTTGGTVADRLVAVLSDPPALKKLLEEGVDLDGNATTRPLIYAAGLRHGGKNGKDDTEALALLLAAKADVDICTEDGTTAAMKAALNGHKDSLELLLQAKADVNREELIIGGGWCMSASANLERLVLGCIEAEFCNQIIIFQKYIFSRSTRFSQICTAPNLTI